MSPVRPPPRHRGAGGVGYLLTPKKVEAHIANIFSTLELFQAPDNHRRVLAVLTYLRS